MTNEGLVAGEAESGTEERERGVVAYIGRASFRMEHTPLPGNDNTGDGAIVQVAASREDTMRIRIPAPAPDIQPSVAWAPPEIDVDRDIVELPAPWSRRVVTAIGASLVARLELPRWILASMTALVFAGGVLVAASVIGGTRPALAVRTSTPAAPEAAPPVPTAPAATTLATVEPVAPPPAVVAERVVSTRRAAKPATSPARRSPKKAAPPPPSSSAGSGESMIAAGKSAGPAPAWVDPFAE